MNPLLRFESEFLSNLSDLQVRQNAEYNLSLRAHAQTWKHRGDKTQSF